MNVKKIKEQNIRIFGDDLYRGKCVTEVIDQINFVSWLKENYNEYWMLLIHPKNEGKRTYNQVNFEQQSGGLKAGISDLVIPAGDMTFVCELKRSNHTKSVITQAQITYLALAQKHGSFACVALGCEGAKKAFKHWLKLRGVKQ